MPLKAAERHRLARAERGPVLESLQFQADATPSKRHGAYAPLPDGLERRTKAPRSAACGDEGRRDRDDRVARRRDHDNQVIASTEYAEAGDRARSDGLFDA